MLASTPEADRLLWEIQAQMRGDLVVCPRCGIPNHHKRYRCAACRADLDGDQ